MQAAAAGKWDSSTDVTSIPGSSPPRSPSSSTHYLHSSTRGGGGKLQGGAAAGNYKGQSNSFDYIVQSPSQYDGDSIYNYNSYLSSQSSPNASPRRSYGVKGSSGAGGDGKAFCTTCSVIDEEDDRFYVGRHRLPPAYRHPTARLSARIRLCLTLILCCGALLGLIIVIMWLALRPTTAPQVALKNMVFHSLYIGPGTDASGVPTNMLTLNCTLQLEFNNMAKHLKAHLQPLHMELRYSKLSIATHKVHDYSQAQNSQKIIPLQMQASNVPLYGAAYDLPTGDEVTKKGFDLKLHVFVSIHSHYYIVWRMVTAKYLIDKTCNVTANTKTMALISPIDANSCF